MFYQIKSNIMYRNYSAFGYITDNRNYCYNKLYDNNPVIGDKIVSETGALFLSVMSLHPKQISELVFQIRQNISDVEYDIIYKDSMDFFNLLVKESFIVSGKTAEECKQNDINSWQKLISEKTNNSFDVMRSDIRLDTQDYFNNYFNHKPLLRSLYIEITSICNERCIHCYIPHELKNNHMDLGLFNKIVDESIELKVLNFTLSGGEPMLHPNFLQMINRCKKENISLNILSNLTALSEEIVTELRTNPLISIQASLYSINPDIHDEITKLKGSCNITKKAIRNLVENNINVQISCPIIKQNIHCYLDVIGWAKTLNIHVSSDYNLLGKYNSNTDNLNCRLDYTDTYDIINNVLYKDINILEKEIEEKKALTIDDPICSVCRHSFCVSENGNVYPCAGWQSFVLGDLNRSTLNYIWNESNKTKYLRNLKIKDFNICSNCDDRVYCSICMVINSNENKSGDPMKVSKYHCDITRLKKEIYIKKKMLMTASACLGYCHKTC